MVTDTESARGETTRISSARATAAAAASASSAISRRAISPALAQRERERGFAVGRDRNVPGKAAGIGAAALDGLGADFVHAVEVFLPQREHDGLRARIAR